MDRTPTKERLAQALHAAGAFDLEAKARAGAYDDFESESATPKLDLIRDLVFSTPEAIADPLRGRMVDRVKAGEFDNTREEGEAWYQKQGHKLLPPRGEGG